MTGNIRANLRRRDIKGVHQASTRAEFFNNCLWLLAAEDSGASDENCRAFTDSTWCDFCGYAAINRDVKRELLQLLCLI